MEQSKQNLDPATSTPLQPSTAAKVGLSIGGSIGVSLIITFITAYPLTTLLFKLSGSDDPGLGGIAVLFFVAIFEFIILTLVIVYASLRRSGNPQHASKFLKGLGIFIAVIIGIILFFYILITVGTKVFDALGI